jgi:hypothetical protein
MSTSKEVLLMESIVKELAAMTPTAPSEVSGDLDCFFCNAWSPNELIDHEADCLWRRAVEVSRRVPP